GSEEIAKLKRDNQPADAALAAMKAVGGRIKTLEDELRVLEATLTDLTLRIPNPPHAAVPVGNDSSNNKEERRWGEQRQFSFKPRAHWDLGEALGILDFD